MATEGQKPEEMIELQTTVRALEVEVLGRYVSKPEHLRIIRRILAAAFDGLAELGKETVKEAQQVARWCPRGYLHDPDCLCVPYAAATSHDDYVAEQRRAAIRDDGGE